MMLRFIAFKTYTNNNNNNISVVYLFPKLIGSIMLQKVSKTKSYRIRKQIEFNFKAGRFGYDSYCVEGFVTSFKLYGNSTDATTS